MNYRHSYHAGNFCDVLKHVTLIALIDSLSKKDTPYCYIDTHAGRGFYDLQADTTQKTKEYLNGIEKVIQKSHPPELVKRYLNFVHVINNRLSKSTYASLEYYPGSPLIAQEMLRARDRIIACELHPEEYQALRNALAKNKQIATHHTDGFLGLKAFLPPAERRGLVLIDPPYEDTDEFTRLGLALPGALKKWESGIYAIWYPIKEMSKLNRFYASLKQHIKQPIFIIEMTIYPDLPNHLNGCGLAIINPPWQFDQTMNDTLHWLFEALSVSGQGGFKAYFLNK